MGDNAHITISENDNKISLPFVFDAFMPYIKRRAKGALHRLNEDNGGNLSPGLDEDDLVQEGLIGLYRAVERYNSKLGFPFAAYATSAIDNSVSSALQKATRKKHEMLNSGLPLEKIDFASFSPSPEEIVVLRTQLVELIERIGRELSAFELRVLALHIDGYDLEAASFITGKSVKAVENALTRARRKIKIFKD